MGKVVFDITASVDGFVAGVLNQQQFYRRLLKRKGPLFVASSIRALLRRPRIAPRLFRAILQPRRSTRSATDACLLSLAVLPEASGRGRGRGH